MKTLATLILAGLALASIALGTAGRPSAPTEFAVLFHESQEGFAARSGTKAADYWEAWGGYIGRIGQSGKLVSGSALQAPSTGWSSPSREEKTRISGYLIIRAESLEEVRTLVAGCPALKQGGGLEIRPLEVMSNNGGGL
ncbi:MAG: YciI family protein [Fimbriimonadaceae bacterium]|nr:YciI family protein [Fimbriimonadaceae bacterium]